MNKMMRVTLLMFYYQMFDTVGNNRLSLPKITNRQPIEIWINI